jgi:hypothetical protein
VTTPLRIAGGLAVALLLLTGCGAFSLTGPAASTPAPAITQSREEACTILATAMNESTAALDKGIDKMSTDPTKSVAALKSFTSALAGAVAKVHNPKVKAKAAKAVSAMKKLTSALEAAIKDPAKLAGVSGKLKKVQTELAAIGTVCDG